MYVCVQVTISYLLRRENVLPQAPRATTKEAKSPSQQRPPTSNDAMRIKNNTHNANEIKEAKNRKDDKATTKRNGQVQQDRHGRAAKNRHHRHHPMKNNFKTT